MGVAQLHQTTQNEVSPALRIPQKLTKIEACHVTYRLNVVSFPLEPFFITM